MRSNLKHVTVIPAEPGYALLGVDEEGPCFWADPVIAWRIEVRHVDGNEDEFYDCVQAITAEGILTSEILRFPDGRIVFLCDREFHKEHEALAYALEQRVDELEALDLKRREP